ncbi:TetR/AcrR family transcriptional regulator [Nonomuraea typhae]|uniref:TetR/AcrR family transcriptional regulator n=1 Tax=Nonomuraea typhae TaxID=2603600 RepID=UPI0012FCDD90|nr:TetR/AcrR family transcriptional regulator [Nonomuraea typhae]
MAKRAERPGDPIKLIGLLWRPAEAVSRSGLTPRRITEAAIAVADGEGIDALTIRRIAGDLGVSPMALYPYIAGRPELIELMLDAVAAEVYAAGPLPAQAGAWRERVERVAHANWACHMAHPWTVELPPGRPVPGPGVSGKYEAELAAFEGIGLGDMEMDQALVAVLGLVSSTARQVLSLRRIREESTLTDRQWWESVGPVLATAMSGASYPIAERVSTTVGEATGMASDPEGSLRFGLTTFLDGLARRVGAAG